MAPALEQLADVLAEIVAREVFADEEKPPAQGMDRGGFGIEVDAKDTRETSRAEIASRE